MTLRPLTRLAFAVAAALAASAPHAAVTPEEAAKLKTELTPLGAERAGNKDGSIPAWTGGYTTPMPGFVNGGRRGDPFAGDKPLYTVNAANMDQYTAKLTDGTRALLKKYPKTFHINVYKTMRTAAAPQWLYDNTARNAVNARIEGDVVKGALGGIPFPIPKTGREVTANHELHWRGAAWQTDFRSYLGTSDGKLVLTVAAIGDFQMPYYFKDEKADKFNGEYWMIRTLNSGPPVRAGEAAIGRENLDQDKTAVWVYLSGQRRVRKLPNGCCDTPTPVGAGVMSFDETEVMSGRNDRFDWKIIGKQEMLIPYNSNRMNVPVKDSDLLMEHHLNPELLRWELHRVWVIESTLKPGQRHQAARSRYYLDEDTWVAVLGDRWDGNNQLWKTLWANPVVVPDLPATTPLQEYGFNDLISGTWSVNGIINERPQHYKIVPQRPATFFTPEAMAGDGVR